MRQASVSTGGEALQPQPLLEVVGEKDAGAPIPETGRPGLLTSTNVEPDGSRASTWSATATLSLMSSPSPSRTSTPERRWNTSAPSVYDADADAGGERPRQADGVRGRGGAGGRELRTRPHRRVGRDPDPRESRESRGREALHHAPARRHEPAVGASAQDSRRSLRHDGDTQRVREGPVVARAHHRRKRVHLLPARQSRRARPGAFRRETQAPSEPGGRPAGSRR